MCEFGFRRVGNKLYGGMCLFCNCNNYVERCDINIGRCIVSFYCGFIFYNVLDELFYVINSNVI